VRHEEKQFDALSRQIEALLQGGETYPHCVEIHPTDFCNQACSYCFHGGVGEDVSRRGEMFTVDDYCALVDELAEIGVEELSVSGGGEPLLYRGIGALLQHVVRSPLSLRVVTNANVIPPDAVDALTEAAEVRVSLDSVQPEVYNRQRGLRGGNLLGRTLNNLRQLRAARESSAGRVRLACTFLISDVNQHEIESFARTMLEDVGVDTVVYKQDIYGRIAADDPAVRHRLDELSRVYGDRVEARDEQLDEPIGGPCVVSYSKVAFNPYGELYSCCLGSQPGERNGLRFGSLRDFGGFRQLWAASAATRSSMVHEGVSCQDCNHTDRLINITARAALLAGQSRR
jgi:MoaA/NifB/PqqE/SkfB family radical SAM enzyme